MGRPARLAAGAVFVLGAIAGAGVRSGASRDAFPSGAWERHRFNGGAVAVCFEGCCGSMCWPRERPATHAAAGAAARGVRGVGDCFTRSELGNEHRRRRQRRGGGALLLFVLKACCGGMCWPRERPATHAAAGAAARGVRGIGGFFHALGAWERHRRRRTRFLRAIGGL